MSAIDAGLHVPGRPPPFAALARSLEAIASPTRLELLHALRVPRALNEIRVAASRSRDGEADARALSRQTVTHHLEHLLQDGLVRRETGEGTPRGDVFVLNPERVFALVDEMRDLVRLRPLGAAAQEARTVVGDADAPPPLPDGPRLVVAYGREDGAGFPLAGPSGSVWRVGRGAVCEIRLEYDPYLSSVNTEIRRGEEGLVVRDLGSRNGTRVNWRPVPRDGQLLKPGDALGVGRSLLVFQTG
jgi:DNA-binding transcriptional ArsR family regulator